MFISLDAFWTRMLTKSLLNHSLRLSHTQLRAMFVQNTKHVDKKTESLICIALLQTLNCLVALGMLPVLKSFNSAVNTVGLDLAMASGTSVYGASCSISLSIGRYWSSRNSFIVTAHLRCRIAQACGSHMDTLPTRSSTTAKPSGIVDCTTIVGPYSSHL